MAKNKNTCSKVYHTLLGRPSPEADWEIVFGDYEIESVVSEQESYENDDYYKQWKTIATSDSVDDIDSIVMSLNQENDNV